MCIWVGGRAVVGSEARKADQTQIAKVCLFCGQGGVFIT